MNEKQDAKKRPGRLRPLWAGRRPKDSPCAGGDSAKVRMRYVFTGCVQGVGFRYRAYHAANSLGLTGWVRNEFDGSVTLEVQGGRSSIDAMLGMIENSPYIEIDDIRSREIPADPGEHAFEIAN